MNICKLALASALAIAALGSGDMLLPAELAQQVTPASGAQPAHAAAPSHAVAAAPAAAGHSGPTWAIKAPSAPMSGPKFASAVGSNARPLQAVHNRLVLAPIAIN